MLVPVGLEPALDINQAALGQELLANFTQASPDLDIKPIRGFLGRPIGSFPAPVYGDRELADFFTVGGKARFGSFPK